MHRDNDDASPGELIGRLSMRTARLLRPELHLARAEAARTARHASGFLAALAVAAVLGLVALAMAVTVIVLELATAISARLADGAPLGAAGSPGRARRTRHDVLAPAESG